MRKGTHIVLITVLAGACSCKSEEGFAIYDLCTPDIQSVEQVASDSGTVSTAGATLKAIGNNFWLPYSSSQDAETTPEPYALVEDLEVLAGTQVADVVAAYELSLPDTYYSSIGQDGIDEIQSDCESCVSCMVTNENGCGGCDNACRGCQQIVEFKVPQLLEVDGQATGDGGALLVPLVVVARSGRSNVYYYELEPACLDGVDNDGDGDVDSDDAACAVSPWSELLACEDGLDNDLDGWIDAQDPGCFSAVEGVTELEACADGLDNDLDGVIDLEDPECMGDPLGQSEHVSVAPRACANGVDDDGDGLVDQRDPRCQDGMDDSEDEF